MVVINEKLMEIALPWGCDADFFQESRKEKREKIEEIFGYLKEKDLVSYSGKETFVAHEQFNYSTSIIEVCVRLKNGAILRLHSSQKLDGEEYCFEFDRLGSIKNDTNFLNSFKLRRQRASFDNEQPLDVLKAGIMESEMYLSHSLKDLKEALEFDKEFFLENLEKEFDAGLVRYVFKGEQAFLAINSREEKEIDEVLLLSKNS